LFTWKQRGCDRLRAHKARCLLKAWHLLLQEVARLAQHVGKLLVRVVVNSVERDHIELQSKAGRCHFSPQHVLTASSKRQTNELKQCIQMQS
jgi:hypothetical protein